MMNQTTFHSKIHAESPSHLHSHLLLLPYTQATQTKAKESASQRTKTRTLDMTNSNENKQRTANSSYKKLAVQWLNEVQFFNQTFVQVDSFVLRNRQLLIAANRYQP